MVLYYVLMRVKSFVKQPSSRKDKDIK